MECLKEECKLRAIGKGLCRRHYDQARKSGDWPIYERTKTWSELSNDDRRNEILFRVEIDSNGCWIWQRATTKAGYGSFRGRGAHVISWEVWVGEVPRTSPRSVLDHVCRTRACVNPDHLELVTDAVNIARGICPTALAVKTRTCSKGHSLEGEGVRVRKHDPSRRECVECARDRTRRYRARKAQRHSGNPTTA